MTKQVFLDTNLFLRYLTNDIPEQAGRFEQLLDQAAGKEIKLVTSVLVLAEVVWTLESFYKLSKEAVREKILAILNTPGLEVEKNDLILQAAVWYVDKNIDFIDAYNAAWAIQKEVDSICTFDRKHFRRIEGIEVREP